MMKKGSDILRGKLNTEFKTVSAMIEIYCKAHHSQPCTDCHSLESYAETRLDRCPYGENKPTCNCCPIHCYKPEPKEKMRIIMRYSGPRMLLHHPILAIRHIIHEKREVPDLPKTNLSNRHLRMKSS
ncbi:conserved hypothetical protein [Vibrio nigripulchritudo POn4]|nr:conserved hypothetical protein [Vibrio nigripulchritudo AM115]CCN68025.1 conserved hypothetical protein [Vibrio nigripulchritudo POn4]